MNLQAKFPAGATEATVHGLHQWDYGRKLDIDSASLLGRGVVQVHFACAGMTEAVVRLCDVAGRTTSAAIPDACLVQTAPVLAWVFCEDETEGFTALKITMPVTARTMPSAKPSEPPENYADQYTALIQAANNLVANTYTRSEIDAALGAYINDVDALIGGGD